MTTLAGETVLRTALVVWATDPTATLSPVQRTWVLSRVQSQAPLTGAERDALRPPLLAYYAAAQPRSVELVAKQFGDNIP